MERAESPYRCHVFVCTNTRENGRKSCGDALHDTLKDALKQAVAKHGWQGSVRVSSSGCLGQCATGPNVMIYPQGIWFSSTALDDVPEILQTLQQLLEDGA